MKDRYQGKRFFGFLLTSSLLFAGLILGNPESYSSFAGAIGIIYAAYLSGQSYTDGKNNGQD